MIYYTPIGSKPKTLEAEGNKQFWKLLHGYYEVVYLNKLGFIMLVNDGSNPEKLQKMPHNDVAMILYMMEYDIHRTIRGPMILFKKGEFR
jgi:hypothetical protein